INGQTCKLLESVADPDFPMRAAPTPALADLDADGDIEIVARRNDQGLIAFSWNEADGKYETLWTAGGESILGDQAWDGPSLHDLDDDGFAEVILRDAVYDGRTGTVL